MNCPLPSSLDVRHFLEGFCLDTQDQINFTVTFTSGATVINMGSTVAALRSNMAVSGSGIATGTVIESVDYTLQQITISIPTTSQQTDSTLTVTKNTF